MNESSYTDLLLTTLSQIQKDIRDIRKEIKELNAFKWRVVGIVTVSALVATIVGNLALSVAG